MEKRIEQAALSRGDSETHLELMGNVVKDVENSVISRAANMGSMNNSILPLINLLKIELEKEDKAIISIRKNELTLPIAVADGRRDRTFLGLKYHVRAFTYSIDDRKAEAARRLQVLIDNYGNINDRSYKRQTEALQNFLRDIDAYNADDVEAIGAEIWINDLESTNNDVRNIMEDRLNLNIERASEDIREVRSRVDALYYRIAAIIEAGYIISEGVSYGALIDKISERIREYRNTINIHKGRIDANKNKEEGGFAD